MGRSNIVLSVLQVLVSWVICGIHVTEGAFVIHSAAKALQFSPTFKAQLAVCTVLANNPTLSRHLKQKVIQRKNVGLECCNCPHG